MTYGLTVAAALGCALISGLFFAFSVFVMKAFGRISAEKGMAAMQSVNAAVLNPLFFGAFFGTALLCCVLVYLGIADPRTEDSAWLFAGAGLYLVCTILVTVFANVPMNKALEPLDPATPDGERYWRRYLSVWTLWNHVRTVGSFAAAACFILALD